MKRNTTRYSRDWRATRKNSGICRYCPAKSRPGCEACDDCAKSKTEKVKSKYYRNREAGLCVTCGIPAKDARCPGCKDKTNTRSRERRAELKLRVLTHYSGATKPSCYCCNESVVDLLTIDHINGGGNKHRASLSKHSGFIYEWLVSNSFPTGFRTACWNCNVGASFNNGVCPHGR